MYLWWARLILNTFLEVFKIILCYESLPISIERDVIDVLFIVSVKKIPKHLKPIYTYHFVHARKNKRFTTDLWKDLDFNSLMKYIKLQYYSYVVKFASCHFFLTFQKIESYSDNLHHILDVPVDDLLSMIYVSLTWLWKSKCKICLVSV